MKLRVADPRFANALASVKIIVEEQKRSSVVEEGVYRLITSDQTWHHADRDAVNMGLHRLINAALETAVLPRFSLPAEFIAAAIVLFVGEHNYRIACNFFEGNEWASQLADDNEHVEAVRPDKLFSFITQIYAGVEDVLDAAESMVRGQAASRATKAVDLELSTSPAMITKVTNNGQTKRTQKRKTTS